MFKSKKFSIALAIVFICTVLFTQGAIANDQNPFTKTNNLNSFESKANIKFSFTGTNLSSEEQKTMLQLMPLLSNLSIDLNTKSIKNSDNTNSNQYLNMSLNLMGMPMNFEIWAKSDISNGKPNVTGIIKMPKNIPLLSGNQGSQKDYLVIDTAKINSLTNSSTTPNVDFNKISESGKKIADELSKSLLGLETTFNFKTDKGDIVVTTPEGNVNAHGYEIKLDDAGFKSVLKYIVNNISQNKELVAELKDYVNVLGLSTTNNDFDKQFASFVDGFNKVFDSLKDVKIVGDKGIVFDYAVNSDGYIVSESGTIDLLFDLQKLIPAINQAVGSQTTQQSNNETGIYNLKIDFNVVNYSLNKDIKIDYPTLTSDNSMDIMDLANSLIQTTPVKTEDSKQLPSKVVKTAVPVKKTVTIKKATAVKKAVPAKKAAPAKKVTTVKKKTPAKKAVPAKTKKPAKKVVKKIKK